MKNLLNITVFASAVLSIFSTSLALYEVPDIKEALSKMDNGQEVQESSTITDIKRIYISHDLSNKGRDKSAPLLVADDSEKFSTSAENYINVFGVQIPTKNASSNIQRKTTEFAG